MSTPLTPQEIARLAAAFDPDEAARAAAQDALDSMQTKGDALLREPHRRALLVLDAALAEVQQILEGGE